MSTRQKAPISSRKEPQQSRSAELVLAILDAATQVLAAEGAGRFTTARVAERAGVSVGSLYQYFPNKAAILFRLQRDEWRNTAEMLSRVLEEPGKPPLDRLRTLVDAFVRSECEEAALRVALSDAAPLYRDAPEAQAARQSGERAFALFLREALPSVSEEARATAGDLVMTTLSQVGKRFSLARQTPSERKASTEALADMLVAYLRDLEDPARPVR